MKAVRIIVAPLALLAAVACQSKPTASSSPTASATVSTSAPKPSSSAATLYRNEDLAVGADYEEAAEKQIDAKNYRAELEKVAAELAPAKSAAPKSNPPK